MTYLRGFNMKRNRSKPLPGDFEASCYSWLFASASRFPKVTGGLSRFIFTISPGVPVDLRRAVSGSASRRVAKLAFCCGLFCCLVVTGFISWTQGTLIGHDRHRLYFANDYWNLSLYLVICPAYVAAACTLISVTIGHWAALTNYSSSIKKRNHELPPGRRLGLALFLTFLFCCASTTTYMYDIVNSKTDRVYWFLDQLADGARVPNRAGYYYIILNFGLLFVTVVAVLCFASLSTEVIQIGSNLESAQIKDFGVIRERLKAYTLAYLLAKILATIYMANAFIWRDSPLQGDPSSHGSLNLKVTGVALTVIGVFFIAVPRMYVELKWFQFADAANLLSPGDDDVKDIRPLKTKQLAGILDFVLYGGFLGAWWNFDISPLHWIHKLSH